MEGWKVITDISWGHMGNFFFLQLERQKGLGFRSPPQAANRKALHDITFKIST
jgi:hypothetical protein